MTNYKIMSTVDWGGANTTALPTNETIPEHDGHSTPYSIIFLFGVFAIGAAIRLLLTKIRLPYTVVLFVLGVCFGIASTYYTPLRDYTELTRISPHHILYIFLPILIFESAFAMDAHTFIRCFIQCLLLAVPGLLISSALTAVLSVNLFTSYNWSWPTALLFGSILSATDPVAVVALLREVGTSKTLSTLVEGESLLNDGSAIVAYAVLIKMVVPGAVIDAGDIVVQFCQISLGGPLLGFVMGKISVFCLSKVFNDAVIEITITLSSAYITYYLAEAVLHVSGVLALVALGVVISAEKDSISPEVEVFVHKFWEKLSYLANTVIFVVVGVVVAETADYIKSQDWFLICATYIGSTVFRFMMIGILSPALSRLGYGLRWQDAVVMTWGGLRGAVGLALALLVSEQEGIDKEQVGHKILIHVSGIVVLTLLVNATTIKPLLQVLGMSEISKWKRHNMTVAVRHLRDIQGRSINVQRNNQFLTDAYWKEVEEVTTIKNPFSTHRRIKKKELLRASTESVEDFPSSENGSYAFLRFSSCPDCDQQHVISPSAKEHEEMFHEARLRMINAQKVSYWRQFENGLLAQENVRVLLSAADTAADKDKGFITVAELKSYWKIPFLYEWMEKQLRINGRRQASFNSSSLSTNLDLEPGQQKSGLKRWLRHKGFNYMVYTFIVLGTIPLGMEAAYRLYSETRAEHPRICYALQVVNFIFLGLFVVEIILKHIKYEGLRYWKSHWNRFDFSILILYLCDLIVFLVSELAYDDGSHKRDMLTQTYCILRLIRIARLLRLLRLLRYRLLCTVNSIINSYLYAGYDIGCGFLMGEEEVVKMIEEIVDYQPIAKELQSICEQNRNQMVRELALLQEEHPSVAVAVKTRHVSRHVLNNSRDELNDLKEKGLLDDGVYDLLIGEIEKQMKRLASGRNTILPAPASELLKNVEWIGDHEELFNYIKSRAVVVKYPKGKTLCATGDVQSGIYIITVGIVKIEGHVTNPLGQTSGQLPNTDSFHWFSSQGFFEDCLTAGNVLGELGVLTRTPKCTTASCETEVQAFHVAQEDMEYAFSVFKDQPSIEYKLWRTCSLRIAKTVLKTSNPQYANWSMGRIMMHLQKAVLPRLGVDETSFTLESEMQDVILIQGLAEDPNTAEMYRGVSYIPRTVHTLQFEAVNRVKPLLLVVGSLDLTGQSAAGSQTHLEWAERRQRWSICPPAQALCLLHQVRRRSAAPIMRSTRALSRVSRSSWVEGLPEYFGHHDRSYSQPVELSDERPRILVQPDVTVATIPLPGEVTVGISPRALARRRSTIDAPFDLKLRETSAL